jgi:hypothetical protein
LSETILVVPAAKVELQAALEMPHVFPAELVITAVEGARMTVSFGDVVTAACAANVENVPRMVLASKS